MKPIIEVEGLTKVFKLGSTHGSYLTLRDTIRQWFHPANHNDEKRYIKALDNVSFSVKPGEKIGVIGKNGAGKSTLLKILSRITPPTGGRAILRGKVASLLEVGTGFHGELTGRENIFLNGAILGMKRNEIKKKLDEIVAFSGVERFLDTPLKHYSSGMQVRLAFAVAAHLETDILLIDEVLAVGDAEFQKKSIEKMQNLSNSNGKTVIFVSHNLDAIIRLCNSAYLLKKGQLVNYGKVNEIINQYLEIENVGSIYQNNSHKKIYIKRAEVQYLKEKIRLNVNVFSNYEQKCSIDFRIKTVNNVPVGFSTVGAFNSDEMLRMKTGENLFSFEIDINNWAKGKFLISIDLTIPNVIYFERLENILLFEVIPLDVTPKIDLNWNYGAILLPVKYLK